MSDEACLQLYFQDLAEQNEAAYCQVHSAQTLGMSVDVSASHTAMICQFCTCQLAFTWACSSTHGLKANLQAVNNCHASQQTRSRG